MDYQSQTEQFDMTRGVNQVGVDNIVSSNNVVYPEAFPQAIYPFPPISQEAMDAVAEAVLGPNPFLGLEQNMGANNEQAPFDDDWLSWLSQLSQPQYVTPANLEYNGGNNYQWAGNQQMASSVTGVPGTGGSDSWTVAQVPQLSDHMDLDPVTVADQPSALGPALISGSGNDSDEGINNGDAGASVMSPSMEDKEHTPVAQAPTSAGAASSTPQTVYPSPTSSNKSLVTGGKAKKPRGKVEGTNADPKPYKRKVCTEACTNCRTSKIKCAFDKDPNTCLGCFKKGLSTCDRGRTTDRRTRKAIQDEFPQTVDGCKKYLADFLILIYTINARKQREGQGWPAPKLTTLGIHLSTGHPNLSLSADLLTDETLPPQWVETAQAHVRLDALAGLQLDLQGIEDNVVEMRRRLRLCVEGTRERVRTLGRYLYVLINDGGHYVDAKTSLANVFKSRAPFSQIDNDMSGQFSSISDDADKSDLVKSLVGHVDRLPDV